MLPLTQLQPQPTSPVMAKPRRRFTSEATAAKKSGAAKTKMAAPEPVIPTVPRLKPDGTPYPMHEEAIQDLIDVHVETFGWVTSKLNIRI